MTKKLSVKLMTLFKRAIGKVVVEKSAIISEPLDHIHALGSEQPIDINLGIDFGTIFTKVCYRYLGSDESGVIIFNTVDDVVAMIPSVVNIDPSSGRVLDLDARIVNVKSFHYLKMDLAKLQNFCPEERSKRCALASWFLAQVIRCSKSWIHQNQKERLIGRRPIWSANIGVPVEQYDSLVLKDFQTVFRVAWEWENENLLPLRPTETELIKFFEDTRKSASQKEMDCHASPEIAAAIISFINSRDARDDIYTYFDIGGGTVDGVSFKYWSDGGTNKISFYNGLVKELGVQSIKEKLPESDRSKFQTMKFDDLSTLSDTGQQCLKKHGFEIQKLVAPIVVSAREKDPLHEWHKMQHLNVFFGGGGAGSDWYRQTIFLTHKEFQHQFSLIPKYRQKEIPIPVDLNMNGLDSALFRRLAIAYGLSIPVEEWPGYRLPGEVNKPIKIETDAEEIFPKRDFRD